MLSEESRVDDHDERAARPDNASLSRLSHVISKLEERGWVARCPPRTAGA